MDTNPHEDAARWRKVAGLIAALYAEQVPLKEALRFEVEEWSIVASSARINPPSQATVAVLREVLFALNRRTMPRHWMADGKPACGVQGTSTTSVAVMMTHVSCLRCADWIEAKVRESVFGCER